LKKILLHLAIVLGFSLSSNLLNAQCGITFAYWYPFGACTPNTFGITVVVQGAGTNFSVLWPETGNTSLYIVGDTGYHVVCITNSVGCTQCDTFSVNCWGWYGTTGLNEYNSTAYINVYPNPSTGNFNIEFNQAIKKGEIEIISILGKRVYMDELFNASSKEIDLLGLSEGIYFVRIFDGVNYYGKQIIIQSD